MSKKQFWLTAILSTLIMAFIISGVLSGVKLGFNAEWPAAWAEGFWVAWPVALLLYLTVLPKVREFCAWVCRPRALQNPNEL